MLNCTCELQIEVLIFAAMAAKRKYDLRWTRSFSRVVTLGMMLLLLFLTNVNYLIFPQDKEAIKIELVNEDGQADASQTNPAGPDEKSPNSSLSVNEEYVHKQEELQDPNWTNHLFQYMVQCSEKLHVVHFEILSPPPEQAI